MRIPVMLTALLAALVMSASGVAASAPADTLALGLTDASCPVVALEPDTGTPHAAHVSNGTLFHAWRSATAWSSESVATGLPEGTSKPYDGVDLRLGSGGAAAMVYRRAGRLECARRVAGTWTSESLAVYPGALIPVLAMSPVTNEPVVAWAQRGAVGEPYAIRLARRTGGAWVTQTLDTTSRVPLSIGVAVDALDRPRVAWSRLRADGRSSRVVVCAMATDATGPFVAAPVDSDLTGQLALALDPHDGQPRLVYQATSLDNVSTLRYLARLPSGAWDTVTVAPTAPGAAAATAPIALAIGAAGDPFVAITVSSPIAPQNVQGDAGVKQGCFYVARRDIVLLHRAAGAGVAPFEVFDVVHPVEQDDLAMGMRALAADGSGRAAVGWRSPGIVCAPYLIGFARSTAVAGVRPDPGSNAVLRPLVPNPVRIGAPFALSWSLARAASVTFTLHDAAGRRVDERSLGRLEAGSHALPWSPVVPRAGLYWLSLRADGVVIASRSAVLVR